MKWLDGCALLGNGMDVGLNLGLCKITFFSLKSFLACSEGLETLIYGRQLGGIGNLDLMVIEYSLKLTLIEFSFLLP